MKYFRFAAIASLVAFATLFWYISATAGTAAAFTMLYLAGTLAVVELAVSFDNAVVNATHLHRMNLFWRRMFLTVGILIAVVGMRFLLPLVIVAVIGNTSISGAFDLAVNDGQKFAELIRESSHSVYGFGGVFLLMVALTFFVDDEKETNWIPAIERPFIKLAELAGGNSAALMAIRVVFASLIVAAVTWLLNSTTFMYAAIAGLVVFLAIEGLKSLIESLDEKLQHSKVKWIAGGLGTFIYLEILDASFSFDGVIAAFAVSNNLFAIATGLGIGAIFVRSMTIMLDETGTLKTYKYMENGAFLAILFLAITMLIGTFYHLPEWVVAVTSILAIGGAIYYSHIENKKELNGADHSS